MKAFSFSPTLNPKRYVGGRVGLSATVQGLGLPVCFTVEGGAGQMICSERFVGGFRASVEASA